jgi:predicted DsbA family dithiol-disulfide isomerase
MNSSEKLTERLTRLQRWSERCERVLSKEMEVLEKIFRETLVALETEKKESFESLAVEEARIKSDLDLAGKDFSTKKYQLEREANHQRADVHKLEEEYTLIKTRSEQELTRMNEEKLHLQISYDKQMRALKDLYQEKIRNSTVAKAGLLQEWQTAERKLKEVKSKQSLEIDAFQAESRAKINKLQEESQSKQQGWSMALEAMKKELETYSQEKTAIERKLTDLKGEKEKELESVRVGIAVSREQLEVDKATLIEKAEEDERRCHQEVSDLKNKIDEAERELQLLVQTRETKKKDEEEAFTKEEQALKDAIRVESEKRDYEQKLFEPVYETFFENQMDLAPGKPEVLAAQIKGIDSKKLTQCYQSPLTATQLQADIQEGIQFGIQGTPTFFVNGHKIDSLYPIEFWEGLIQELSK